MSDWLTALIIVLFYGAFIFTWAFTLVDLFARGDLSGWQKGLWMLAVVFVPLVGVLAYFALRPRDARRMVRDEEGLGPRSWEIAEIETLVRLRNQGTITDEEYERIKDRVMASAS